MKHALVTYLFDIPPGREARVTNALHSLKWQPRVVAPVIEEASDADAGYGEAVFDRLEDFVHFMSMVVLPSERNDSDPKARLLVEVCADGSDDSLTERLYAAMKPDWEAVLGALAAQGMSESATVAFLRRHRMKMGTSIWHSLLRRPGFCFVGTPGMTVRRIRDEAELAIMVRKIMREHAPAGAALTKLAFVREKVFENPRFKWALFSEPVPLLATRSPTKGVARILRLSAAAFRDYLWVLVPLPLLWLLSEPLLFHGDPLGAFGRAATVLGAELLMLGAATAYTYRKLREEEDADDPLDDECTPEAMEQLMALENFRDVAQNHLSAQSRLKPGWVRYWTLCLALWVVAEVTRLQSAPGFLNKIGTIHFARWYLVPGTNRLVFLSNYDGSWQSYLEDFIARLRQGLSSLWSNTCDFPRTNNLVNGGAGDGARFKRWARCQQLPTPVWHTAYPDLTAAAIRTNAAIRLGLASANSEAIAAQWLSRIGYSVPDALQQDQVPTLVFGGLPKLPCAHIIMVRFGETQAAKSWLAQHVGDVSYGRQEDAQRALVLGFTIDGLNKLGLPKEAERDFPAPFRQGMAHRDRARLLGDFDIDPNLGPQPKRWGMNGNEVDMLCLVYAANADALEGLVKNLTTCVRAMGHEVEYELRLADVPEKPQDRVDAFGFRDGISQPIVRGTKDWAAARQAMHVVNPGEIVLGYPDNLNRIAPTPCADGFDYGRNGSYLVVRHLVQDRAAFNAFINAQVERLGQGEPLGMSSDDVDLRTGRNERQEWVAAKMLGRWSDGTPLVRWPEIPPWLKPANNGAESSGPRRPANDFLLGKEDPDGLRCPFGSHVRRANPRDSLDPGSKVQLAISNRHRILRVGRSFQAKNGPEQGMMFMCLNADIERQFEFLQQTWLLGRNFHGLDNESDPLLGPGGKDQAVTLTHANGMVRLEPLSRFVRMMGGGYFLLPGRDCVSVLAGIKLPAAAAKEPANGSSCSTCRGTKVDCGSAIGTRACEISPPTH